MYGCNIGDDNMGGLQNYDMKIARNQSIKLNMITYLTTKFVLVYVVLQAFDRSFIDNPGPMVVFATPGMLHSGLSLQIFKKWCSNENNMVSYEKIYDLMQHSLFIIIGDI